MADNTANIKVDVDVSEVRRLIDSMQSLSNELQDVKNKADAAGDETEDLSKDLRDLDRDSEKAERGLTGLKQSLVAGAAAGGVAATAMIAVNSAIAAARIASEQFREGLTRLSETNDQVRLGTDSVRTSLQGVQESLAMAVIGGDDMNQTFGAVSAVLQNFERIINENADTISDLATNALSAAIDGIGTMIDIAGSAIIGFNNLKIAAKTVELGILELLNGIIQFDSFVLDNVLGTVQFAIDAFTSLVRTMEGVANVIPGINVDMSGFTDITDSVSQGVEGLRDDLNTFADAVADDTRQARDDYAQFTTSLLQANDDIRNSTNSLAGSFSMISDLLDAGLTESYVEATEVQESYNSSLSRTVDIIDKLDIAKSQEINKLEQITELIKLRTASELEALAAEQERLELKASLGKDLEIEQAIARSEALNAIKQADAEKDEALLQLEEERMARRQDIYDGFRDMTVDALGAIGTGLGEIATKTNESGSKKAKRIFGGLTADLLDASANMILAQSGITALFDIGSGGIPNPAKAAAMVAAGVAAKGAAAGIRAKLGAGGGGGSSASTTNPVPATNVTPGQTRTFVLTNNFNGLTTDPRSVARQLEETLQNNDRLFGT